MLIKVTFVPKMTKTFVQRLVQNHKAVFQTPYGKKAKSSKQGCVVDFLDPDFQEGADTLPRLALTHIALKPNKLVFSQLYDALSSQSDWPENKEKKKKCA